MHELDIINSRLFCLLSPSYSLHFSVNNIKNPICIFPYFSPYTYIHYRGFCGHFFFNKTVLKVCDTYFSAFLFFLLNRASWKSIQVNWHSYDSLVSGHIIIFHGLWPTLFNHSLIDSLNFASCFTTIIHDEIDILVHVSSCSFSSEAVKRR